MRRSWKVEEGETQDAWDKELVNLDFSIPFNRHTGSKERSNAFGPSNTESTTHRPTEKEENTTFNETEHKEEVSLTGIFQQLV